MALADDTPTEAERSLPKAPHCFPSAIVFRPVSRILALHIDPRAINSAFRPFQLSRLSRFRSKLSSKLRIELPVFARLTRRIDSLFASFHQKWIDSIRKVDCFPLPLLQTSYVYFQRLNVMFVFCTISPSFSSTRRNRKVCSIIVVEGAENYNWSGSWRKAKFLEFLVSSSCRCRRQIIRR